MAAIVQYKPKKNGLGNEETKAEVREKKKIWKIHRIKERWKRKLVKENILYSKRRQGEAYWRFTELNHKANPNIFFKIIKSFKNRAEYKLQVETKEVYIL